MVEEITEIRNRVYKYGLVPLEDFPTESVVAELRKANILWNNLVSLHLENSKDYEKLMCDSDPEYKSLKEERDAKNNEINEAYEDKRKARMKARTTSSHDPLVEKANKKIRELENERKEINNKIKPIKERVKETEQFKKLNRKLNSSLNDKFKDTAKVKSTGIEDSPMGMDSVTAGQISVDFTTARRKYFKDFKKDSKKHKLRYHRFDATGYFHYRFRRPEQKQDGFLFNELLVKENEKDRRSFTLEFLEDRNKKGKNSGELKKKPRYKLTAKISGGNRDKDKLYAPFVLVLHRPLPEKAQINNAQIIRTRTGNRFSYFVCFTVREPKMKPIKLRKSDLAIGIDINWRRADETIEVATIFYEDRSRPCNCITLSQPDEESEKDIIKTDNYIEQKKSEMDPDGRRKYSIIQTDDYINQKKSEMDNAAEEMRKEIKKGIKNMNLSQDHKRYKLWNSIVKLPANRTLSYETAYKLAGWANHEPSIFPRSVRNSLSEWRRKYGRKGYKESHNLKRKMLGFRKDHYRKEAIGIVEDCIRNNYKQIVLEELDLSALAEYKNRDDTLFKRARANRVLAAPSEFRSAVKNAAEREGIVVTNVDAYYTSKICSSCGFINKELTGEEEWKCPSCKVDHNRDENAARNIVKRKKIT